MKESDLYAPVRDWFIARGYEIHVEVFDCDIVAVKDGELTAVELKPCQSRELIAQCHVRAQWANYVYGVIGSDPRQIDSGWSYSGIGLLQVRGGKVRQRRVARPQPWHILKRRQYRIDKLMGRDPAQPHEVAGLPSCRQLREQRELREKAA